MTITHRICSTKRHTQGYKIGGENYTRAQAIRLVRKGEVFGARIAKGPKGPYIVSSTTTSLYSLPIVLQEPKTRSRKSVAAKRNKSTTGALVAGRSR